VDAIGKEFAVNVSGTIENLENCLPVISAKKLNLLMIEALRNLLKIKRNSNRSKKKQ